MLPINLKIILGKILCFNFTTLVRFHPPINDLNNSIRIFGLNLQFADDTACSVAGKDVSCLKLALEEAFNHLLLWLESIYLALNADKAKFVVFSRFNTAVPELQLIESSDFKINISRAATI